MEILTTLLRSLRIQDILDIVIITFLIYMFLTWIRNTGSRLVFSGVMLLCIIYFIAMSLHLYITSMILQSFYGVIFIGLIIIFQEEIRRFFERLATWGPYYRMSKKKRRESKYNLDTEILLETVAEFAQGKVGALIVLQGKDPLDRHLKGGYPLDGSLSEPLLESIFDVHSVGHDGAVVVDNGRVEKFACHLPLSSDAKKFGRFGLRHTSALGLSERSDALCIVVSEERGSISVAYEGTLKEIDTIELAEMLAKFYENLNPKPVKNRYLQFFSKNFGVKIASILLALVIWVGFGYQKDSIQRDFDVPIEFRNVPQGWVVEPVKSKKTEKTTITLTGPIQAFKLFDNTDMRVSIDFNQRGVQEGIQIITIADNDILKVPPNLKITEIDPEKITIRIYKN